jgi:hypothetical protein
MARVAKMAIIFLIFILLLNCSVLCDKQEFAGKGTNLSVGEAD